MSIDLKILLLNDWTSRQIIINIFWNKWIQMTQKSGERLSECVNRWWDQWIPQRYPSSNSKTDPFKWITLSYDSIEIYAIQSVAMLIIIIIITTIIKIDSIVLFIDTSTYTSRNTKRALRASNHKYLWYGKCKRFLWNKLLNVSKDTNAATHMNVRQAHRSGESLFANWFCCFLGDEESHFH